jgi:hypothetical protein
MRNYWNGISALLFLLHPQVFFCELKHLSSRETTTLYPQEKSNIDLERTPSIQDPAQGSAGSPAPRTPVRTIFGVAGFIFSPKYATIMMFFISTLDQVGYLPRRQTGLPADEAGSTELIITREGSCRGLPIQRPNAVII